MKTLYFFGLLLAGHSDAASLEALREHLRPDPFGGIVAADRGAAPGPFLQRVIMTGARGGYVSCHLVVKLPEKGAYSLRFEFTPPLAGLQADLYREWFHRNNSDQRYYPDALVPVRIPYRSSLPEPDNRVESQTAQAFWLDIWIPLDASPGSYRGDATLEANGSSATLPVEIRVLHAIVPEEDAVAVDHNSYGSSWIADFFPEARRREGGNFFSSDSFFRLIHAYHRIFYEHRGVMHQLGYGHAGKVGPEFAPALQGAGRGKHIAGWSLYDRHYGPLFDGSAFAKTRRGARPIPFVYLPINPEWPASFLNWGEPGYETEFVSVVSEMERHFREKGWTSTKFELFFNHKKRYKGFPWDGDETRFANDLPYYREYARLLRRAVPPDSPVQFVFRADSSWMMERQFRELAGVVNFWVCGGGMFAWYRDAPALLKGRGDIVWIYGGTPVVSQASASVTLNPLRAWLLGVDGYVHWLAVSPGSDPWFRFDGGGTALVYPGARFGLEEPIPSVRLKLQRNALQDIALLQGLHAAKDEVAQRFNGTSEADWWTPRPKLADTPPENWSNADIDEASPQDPRFYQDLDAAAWDRVRQYALKLAEEAR